MKNVYILLTVKKIHAYGSWSRAMKIHQRATRMNAAHEYMSAGVKAGDPFKRAKVIDMFKFAEGSLSSLSSYACAAIAVGVAGRTS